MTGKGTESLKPAETRANTRNKNTHKVLVLIRRPGERQGLEDGSYLGSRQEVAHACFGGSRQGNREWGEVQAPRRAEMEESKGKQGPWEEATGAEGTCDHVNTKDAPNSYTHAETESSPQRTFI